MAEIKETVIYINRERRTVLNKIEKKPQNLTRIETHMDP